MQFYTTVTATTSGLIASLVKFWKFTSNFIPRRKKSNGFNGNGRAVPINPVIHTGSDLFSGISPKIGDFEPFYLENTGTNGETLRFLPSPSEEKVEAKAPDPVSEVSEPFEKQLPVSQIEPTANPPDPVNAPNSDSPSVPPSDPPGDPTLNRAERRAKKAREAAWERQRRKHDKFVEPQGPKPVVIPRGPRKPRVEPKLDPAPADDLLFDEDLHYRESELWGQFSFRDTILDQLDRYWVYLARMKKHDHDSYEFYKEVGATVIPPISWFLHKGPEYKRDLFKDIGKTFEEPELSPWWKEHRPTFGCVTFGINKETEKDELEYRDPEHPNQRLWIPKFLYFVKYRTPPPDVQPTTNGDVYGMTIWWDRPHEAGTKWDKKYKGGVPEQYCVYISADGSDIHVLPQHQVEYLPIRRKHASHGYKRGHTFTIPHHTWRIPGHYTRWAKRLNTTPNLLLCNIFLDAARAVEQSAYSMVRVAVHNNVSRHGELTATFGVDVKRLPYFFQDRDITLTDSGSRKRAFHIVRAHERKNGAVVRFHFRGEKDFTWAGYQVNITIPGRDHFVLQEFDMGLEDMDASDLKRGEYCTQGDLGRRLTKYMDEGKGGIK